MRQSIRGPGLPVPRLQPNVRFVALAPRFSAEAAEQQRTLVANLRAAGVEVFFSHARAEVIASLRAEDYSRDDWAAIVESVSRDSNA